MHSHGLLAILLSNLLVLAGAGCAHGPLFQDDRAAAIAVVNAHAVPEEREACPADVIPAVWLDREWMNASFDCRQRLTWCAELCQAGNPLACYYVAGELAWSMRDDAERSAVNVLLHRSCARGLLPACSTLASWLLEGDKPDAEAVSCAIRTLEQTCKRRDASGCLMYAMERVSGVHIEKDLGKAREALKRVCLSGQIPDFACTEVLERQRWLRDMPE